MNEDQDPLVVVFASGIDVSKRLGEKCPEFPRKVDILIQMVEEKLSVGSEIPFRIVFHPRNFQSRAFIGSIEEFAHEAHIYFDRDRSLCWRRFVVAKEMCHLLFAPYGTAHLASTPDQIEQLLTSILAGLEGVDIGKDHAASTEVSTLFMALEILLPHSERKNLDAKAEAIDVATKYRIPEQMAKLYLSSQYANLMEKAYKVPFKIPGVDDPLGLNPN